LEASKEDLNFQEQQRFIFEKTIVQVEMARDLAMKIEDADYIQHSSDLNKSHLKLNAWLTEPLENPSNNFVDSLLSRYLQDL
jgi:hypothetical protein